MNAFFLGAVVLAILLITGLVNVSWWWVLGLLAGPLMIALALIVVLIILAFVAYLVGK